MKDEMFSLSEKSIQEDYEDLVFKKVFSIHCEEESKAIIEEIKQEESPIPPKNIIEKILKSKEHKENIKTINKIAKKMFVFTASFFFVIALSISSAVIAFADIRDAVTDILYHLVFEENERYTKISLAETTGFIDPEIYDWEGAYAPTYIPKGFKFVEKFINSNEKAVVYSNGIDTFTFIQINNSSYRIDSESVDEIRYFDINGSEAVFISKYPETQINWVSGETMLWIHGTVSEEDLIKIAKNIKILK